MTTRHDDAAQAFTDCELRDDWFLQQDVNAWTSLAYVVAAAAVVDVARGRSRSFLVLAGLLLLEGAGSFAYHGTSRGGALHDAALVGIVVFVAAWHVATRRRDRAAALAGAVGLVAGWAVHSVRAAVDVLVASAAVAIVGSVVRDRRRHDAIHVDAVLVVLITAASLAWILGGAGSPVCDPPSVWQPHSAWHVLSAAAVLRWAAAAGATHQ